MQLSLGLMARRHGIVKNACVQEGTDGIWYGAGPGVGQIVPPFAIDGTPMYAFIWASTAAGEEGTILMSFGDLGDTKLTDVKEIVITSTEGTQILTWDATNTDYRTVNLELTDALIADYELDKVRCFKADVLIEGLLLHYTFSAILTGSR